MEYSVDKNLIVAYLNTQTTGKFRLFARFIPEAFDLLMLPVAMRLMRRMGPAPAVSPPASVLVISIEGLGDTVLTVPLLRQARRRWPEALITLLVPKESAALFRHCPYADNVVQVDRFGYLKILPRISALVRLLKAARFVRKNLRGGRPVFAINDVAINTDPWTNITGSAFIAWCSGAAERIAMTSGHGRRRAINLAEERLYTERLAVEGNLHRVEYSLEIPRRLWGCGDSAELELWPSPEDRIWAAERLRSWRTRAGDRLIAIGAGAGDRKRVWPGEAFIGVARRISAEYPCRFVILGGESEAAHGDRIAAGIGEAAISLCREDANRTVAILSHARVYFGNDTGAMHMAAARGVPCLVVSCHPRGAPASHFNSEERYHPWNVPYRYLRPRAASVACREGCVANAPHCILGIAPDEAARELLAFLRENECDRRAAESG